MSQSFGNIKIGNIYKGSTKIGQIYKGSQLVYQSAFNITYVVDSGMSYTEKVKPNTSTLSPTTFKPTKTGWTFVGWRKDKTASSSVLTSDVATGHTTLYAVFKQTITASFKHNPSTVKTTNVTGDMYYNNGNEVGASVKAPTGETTGSWTWRGWSAAGTTTGNAAVSFANGATISGLKANVTYYGLYSSTITAIFKSYNTSKDVTGTRYWNAAGNYTNASVKAPTGATYSGWTWRGWSAAGTTTGNASVAYANGATISGLTANATYYGLYSITITLSYGGNGNTGGSTTAQTGTRYWNASGRYVNPSFKLSANGFTRTNYIFTQWAQSSASGTKYAVGASVVLSNNTIFYAVWLAHNDLIKTLNASDWSVTSNNNGARYTFTKGSSLVMSATNKSWSDIGIRSTSIDITHFKTLQVSVSNKSSGTGLSFNLVTTSGSVSILNGGTYDISKYTGQAYITGYACSGYSGKKFKTAGLTCTKLLFS